MQWLNYQHLLYFWAVARRGTVAAAAEELRLSGPTLSAQIRKLEESLGEKLLRRSGRRLVLTDAGRLLMQYAEEIFSLGQQVTELFRGQASRTPLRMAVGIVDVLPRWLVYRLVQPVLRMPHRVQLIFREDRAKQLLADVAAHELDVVFSDTPVLPEMRTQFSSHVLGESGMGFYAVPRLAAAYGTGFPRCLNGAPLLLLSEETSVGRLLNFWLEARQIRPNIVGRFDDFAMARVFAEAGEGILLAPRVIESELQRRYAMKRIGHISNVKMQFYAISLERKFQHPGIEAICHAEQKKVFSEMIAAQPQPCVAAVASGR